jgi:hypothetical protein
LSALGAGGPITDPGSHPGPSGRSLRRSFGRDALLSLLLIWATASFVEASMRELAGWHQRSTRLGPAYDWRFGTQRLEGLASCLRGVAGVVPAGSQVSFLDPHWDAFFRWRWASYLLPGVDLVLAGSPDAAHSAFVVATGREHPGQGTPVAGGPGCRVYRLR